MTRNGDGGNYAMSGMEFLALWLLMFFAGWAVFGLLVVRTGGL